MTTDAPLTRDRILATAEDVVRRHGPAKATVVDVARALGVTHASVYRHFASKAELREAVVRQWLDRVMQPLAAIADAKGPAPKRLRQWVDALIAAKRKRAAGDPELFAAYFALATEAKGMAQAHVQELVDHVCRIIAAGVEAGELARCDPAATARAVLFATNRFHHPAHAGDWTDPDIDATLDDVWQLLMIGLRPPTVGRAVPKRARKKRS